MKAGLFFLFNAIVIGFLAGCSGSDRPKLPETTDLKSKQVVAGTVTFEGAKVPYGVVGFYGPAAMRDRKSGKIAPLAIGMLDPDGKFSAEVPAGTTKLAIMTDPDVDPGKMSRPGRPGEPAGGVKDNSHGPKPAKKVDPPDAPKADGPKFADAKEKPKFINPLTEKLTDQQKDMLRAVNERYGTAIKSGIVIHVVAGQDINDLQINLRKDGFDLGKKRDD